MSTDKQNPKNKNSQKGEKKHGQMGKRGVTRPMSDMNMGRKWNENGFRAAERDVDHTP